MDTYMKMKPFQEGLFTGLVEVWKDIKNFEGAYQVSSLGRVKSLARTRISKGGSLAPLRERIMSLKLDKSGYQIIGLRSLGKKWFSVHRLVASAFIRNKEDKPTINHKDGNKTNNKVSNLEWSTHSEQMKHAVELDLTERRGSPKFTKEYKREVCEYYANNDISLLELARKFGMSERTAGRCIKGVLPRTTTRVLKSGDVIIEDILTKQEVSEIKELRRQGKSLREIGELYSRSISQIHRITRNQSRITHIE